MSMYRNKAWLVLLLSYAVYGPQSKAEATSTNRFGYLAFGDLRGHLEPCGCDPATDLGGIKRLAIQIERERSILPTTLVFGLGNDLPLAKDSSLKTPFLLETLARLKPDAVLFNTLEIQRASEIEATIKPARHMSIPYVLSNARKSSLASKFAASKVETNDAAIWGYAFAQGVEKEVEGVSPRLLEDWRKGIAASPKKQHVLLFSGSDQELEQIASRRLFDWIVSSNKNEFGVEPGLAEKNDENKLMRNKTYQVAMVPLGGQGILRGGAMMLTEAKPISAYLGKNEPLRQKDATTSLGGVRGSELFQAAKLITWLDPVTAPGEGPLKDLYDRYSVAARDAFRGESAKRLQDLKVTPFAGAAACATCHPEQSKIYAGTAHAHAMKTLETKSKHEDGECVACHSVGANAKGGFVSLFASPQLANVQCENCHGPRLAHTKDPLHAPKPKEPAHEVCVACHLGQHSPSFDFATYWARIKH